MKKGGAMPEDRRRPQSSREPGEARQREHDRDGSRCGKGDAGEGEQRRTGHDIRKPESDVPPARAQGGGDGAEDRPHDGEGDPDAGDRVGDTLVLCSRGPRKTKCGGATGNTVILLPDLVTGVRRAVTASRTSSMGSRVRMRMVECGSSQPMG